jgi:hypothetical protein
MERVEHLFRTYIFCELANVDLNLMLSLEIYDQRANIFES